jgi:hypothetical protein
MEPSQGYVACDKAVSLSMKTSKRKLTNTINTLAIYVPVPWGSMSTVDASHGRLFATAALNQAVSLSNQPGER